MAMETSMGVLWARVKCSWVLSNRGNNVRCAITAPFSDALVRLTANGRSCNLIALFVRLSTEAINRCIRAERAYMLADSYKFTKQY